MLAPMLTDYRLAKSPLQLPYTSGTDSAKVAYRGSGTARAKAVQRPSEPSAKGHIGAADDDETSRGGRSYWWLQAQYRLVASVRWCILTSVPGRNWATNPERY